MTVSNREPQSSWWLQVPIWELPFRNHFRNFPALFRTQKYWSSWKYGKCYDCICLTLLSSSSYSIYYYTLKLSSRIITTTLYKCTSAHSIYTFTLVTNTSVVFAHLRQWLSLGQLLPSLRICQFRVSQQCLRRALDLWIFGRQTGRPADTTHESPNHHISRRRCPICICISIACHFTTLQLIILCQRNGRTGVP